MRKLWIALTIGLFAAGGAALAARQWQHSAPAPANAAPPLVPVVAATVLSHDVPIYRRRHRDRLQ